MPHAAYQPPNSTSPLNDKLRNLSKVRAQCRLKDEATSALQTYDAVLAEAVTTPMLDFPSYLVDPFGDTWSNDPGSFPAPAASIPCTTAADCPSATAYVCHCPRGEGSDLCPVPKECDLLFCGQPGSDLDTQCAPYAADPTCCGKVVECTVGIGTGRCGAQCTESDGKVCARGVPVYYDYPTDDYAKCAPYALTLGASGFSTALVGSACHPVRADPDVQCGQWVVSADSSSHCPGTTEAAAATAAGCTNLAALFSSTEVEVKADGTCGYHSEAAAACSCYKDAMDACTACPADPAAHDPAGCVCKCSGPDKNTGKYACSVQLGAPCSNKYQCDPSISQAQCVPPPGGGQAVCAAGGGGGGGGGACSCYKSSLDTCTACPADPAKQDPAGCACACSGPDHNTGKYACAAQLGSPCDSKDECDPSIDKPMCAPPSGGDPKAQAVCQAGP